MVRTTHATGAEIVWVPIVALATLASYALYLDAQAEKEEKLAARAPGTPGVDFGAGF